ncbi:hypothetical protein OUZ56_028793 [Daphnia magna]|uniref:Uncharacterized protein n=1 Tax=Daphnia magna TaxID=35525 RepID=A0ABR0B4Y4_9CRUS|nr:hypothetical protein OUZ56_028793 [Daphnia magna]
MSVKDAKFRCGQGMTEHVGHFGYTDLKLKDEEKNVSSELKEPKDFLQLMHPCLQISAALW